MNTFEYYMMSINFNYSKVPTQSGTYKVESKQTRGPQWLSARFSFFSNVQNEIS